jgi:hypothetical protein
VHGTERPPGKDRDLSDLEDLEQELAALEHELEIVDGAPAGELAEPER